MKTLDITTKDLINYFFPIRCLLCEHITNQKNTLCLECSSKLKYSHIEHNMADNDLTELFHGRVDLDKAYYHFRNDSEGVAKKIIHQIKYKGNLEFLTLLGNSVSEKVKEEFKTSLILPVPLNPKKEKQRGFNQSQKIAESIFKKEQILSNLVERKIHTQSQTGFGKLQRWQNMEMAFEVNKTLLDQIGEQKQITLVDDVVTTGSTVESIFAKLKSEAPHLRFSLFTLLKA